MTVLFVQEEDVAGEVVCRTLEPGGRYENMVSMEEAFVSVAQRKNDRVIIAVEDSEKGLRASVLKLLLRFVLADELTVVKRGWIEGRHYWSVAAGRTPVKDASRTMILFEPAPGVPNALFRALAAFAGRRIDVHRIASFPSGKGTESWVTLLDVAGMAEKNPLQAALEDAAAFSSRMVILGSYVFSGES